jgi:3-oxoacyl-[acyl-carrier protein] reductase
MGRATVDALAAEGAAGIVVHYSRNRSQGEAAAAEAAKKGVQTVALGADVGKREEAHRLVMEAEGAFGGLDAAVLFAGHPFTREEWFAHFHDLTEHQFMGPLRTDLLGSAYVAQALLPRMAARGRGSLVLVSSTPALAGDVEGFSYLVAKSGLVGLTRALAKTYGPNGVRVNCVAPGSIRTPAMGSLTPREEEKLANESPLRRLGRPEEVARAALFLAGDDSSFVNGQVLVVDGGAVTL